jgi:hypothetical protein
MYQFVAAGLTNNEVTAMPNVKITEKQLDIAFAEMMIGNEPFRDWVLSGSKFAHLRPGLRLLTEELSKSRRMPANSWRHVWCVMPDGTEGETDIFTVFEASDGYRFALHFENKPPHGVLRPNQGEDYPKRAEFLSGHPRYLSYRGWETAIIAPQAFIHRHADRCHPFDRTITYEAIADWIPLFGRSLEGASASSQPTATTGASLFSLPS